MTRLRQMMLEDLQRRNYARTTINNYLNTVEEFAKHFDRPPDQLGLDEIRSYQAYLLKERKMGVRTVGLHTAGLRFFFCKTLKRNYPVEEFPYPKKPRELADHPDPRRSGEADRVRQQPVSSRHVDDALLHRNAPG